MTFVEGVACNVYFDLCVERCGFDYGRYMDSTSPDHLKPDIQRHGPFYSLCQTLFYVFSFRHQALLEMRGGNRVYVFSREMWIFYLPPSLSPSIPPSLPPSLPLPILPPPTSPSPSLATKGAEYLRKLKFERIITSQLNPLKVRQVYLFHRLVSSVAVAGLQAWGKWAISSYHLPLI